MARGIGGTVSSYIAVAALAASGGLVTQATDDEILCAQRDLAREGIVAEPASSAALAGLRALIRRGGLPAGQRIVLINTSSGLKDLDALLAALPELAGGAPSPAGAGEGSTP